MVDVKEYERGKGEHLRSAITILPVQVRYPALMRSTIHIPFFLSRLRYRDMYIKVMKTASMTRKQKHVVSSGALMSSARYSGEKSSGFLLKGWSWDRGNTSIVD